MLSSRHSSKLQVFYSYSVLTFLAQADAGENAPQAPAQEFSLRKGISIPESLQILDLKREDVNSTTLSEVNIIVNGM